MGKRDVMTCGLLLCDVTVISRQRHTSCCYVYVKLQQKGCLYTCYAFSLFRTKRQKIKLVFQII